MHALDEEALVVERRQVGEAMFVTRLEAPEIASRSDPGQFVEVRVGPGPVPLLRLPLSIAQADGERGVIDLVYAQVGPKTACLAAAGPGVRLWCLGPLGEGFRFSGEDGPVLLVGGGTGVPPLLFLGRRLRRAGYGPVLLAGARRAKDLVPEALLSPACTELKVCTEDGSQGHTGLVTDLLKSELDERDPRMVFACGPSAMLAAVALVCRTHEVPCQVSLEAYMACGVGICMGCAVPVVAAPGESEYERYQRVCVQGPVFDAARIDWTRFGRNKVRDE